MYGSINMLAAGFFYNRSPSTLIKIYVPFATLSFILNYVFIQKWGYLGAAATNLIVYSSIPLSVYFNSKALFSFPLGLKKIASAFVVFFILLLISYGANYVDQTLRITIKVILSSVALYLFYFFYKEDKKSLATHMST